jgi:DNA-binding response OmpR family regulator
MRTLRAVLNLQVTVDRHSSQAAINPALHAMIAPDPAAAAAVTRVLVVDDEPEIAGLIGDMLEAAGYAVTLCLTGAVALQHIQRATFDAVVCDLRMPDLDGPALWHELQAVAPALAQRLLFVTGDTLNPGAQAFLTASGCPQMDKPFRRQELLLKLSQLLA